MRGSPCHTCTFMCFHVVQATSRATMMSMMPLMLPPRRQPGDCPLYCPANPSHVPSSATVHFIPEIVSGSCTLHPRDWQGQELTCTVCLPQ